MRCKQQRSGLAQVLDVRPVPRIPLNPIELLQATHVGTYLKAESSQSTTKGLSMSQRNQQLSPKHFFLVVQ